MNTAMNCAGLDDSAGFAREFIFDVALVWLLQLSSLPGR